MADQFAGVFHRRPGKRHDHIARQHPAILGRTFRNIGHQRPGSLGQAHRLGHVRRHVLDAHTQPAAAGFAELLQLANDLGHHIRRHRKPDPDRAAGRRQDRGVHPDHLTVHVEQRPAGIALVDRRIGLQEIVIGAGQLAPARRDDPGRDREPLPQRVAHRHHPVTDPHRIAVAKRDEGQRRVAFHLQQRDIRLEIGADQLGLKPLAGKELDLDLIGALDDMVVGDDVTIGRDHKARAQRFGALRFLTLRSRGTVGPVAVHEVLKELLERRAGRHHRPAFGRGGDDGRGGDVHHRGADAFRQIGETFWRAFGLRVEDRSGGQRQSKPDGDGDPARTGQQGWKIQNLCSRLRHGRTPLDVRAPARVLRGLADQRIFTRAGRDAMQTRSRPHKAP